MQRTNITTGTPWEQIVGYSRAVRIGNTVEVAGTTAADEHGRVVGVGDAAAQTRYIITKMEHALQQCGASLRDVVRTRIYVTNIADWEAVGRVHGEFFATVQPATTLVAVSHLIDPAMLVEIELTAVLLTSP